MTVAPDELIGLYGHLLPHVREVAKLADAERIAWIQKERWIPYPKGEAILRRLDELYNWPLRLRMPNMLIVGPTNNGKTSLIHRFIKGRAAPIEMDDRSLVPVVRIQMPPKPSLALIYSAILKTLSVPHKPSNSIAALQPLALEMLRKVETRMFFVDEVHDIQNAPTQVQYQILSLFKYLGNELQIPIVAVGTERAAQAMQIDPQMANRFEPYTLPRWDTPKLVLQLLASFSCMLPLRRPSRLTEEGVAKLVMNLTDGSIGDITILMEMAARYAIVTGQESITKDTLANCGYVSSAERRHETDLMRAVG